MTGNMGRNAHCKNECTNDLNNFLFRPIESDSNRDESNSIYNFCCLLGTVFVGYSCSIEAREGIHDAVDHTVEEYVTLYLIYKEKGK